MSDSPEAITCEVTGKEIACHDAVQFQGKWVGAEGKAILLERLRTGISNHSAPVVAPVLRRLGGLFVDAAHTFLFMAICTMIGGACDSIFYSHSRANNDWGLIIGFSAGLFLLPFVYFVFSQYWYGKTLGKVVVRCRVTGLTSSHLTFRQSLIRSTIGCIPLLLFTGSLFVAIIDEKFVLSHPMDPYGLGEDAILIAILYVTIDGIIALFDRRQHRALHDRIAGTRVVRVL